MKQSSLRHLEEAFAEQTRAERHRRAAVERKVAKRARQRELERTHKHGSLRFVALVLVLIATAVLVTVAMFETLYLVMG